MKVGIEGGERMDGTEPLIQCYLEQLECGCEVNMLCIAIGQRVSIASGNE